MRTEVLGFYNVDNNRPADPVVEELEALLSLDPFVLGMVECIGNRIPKVRGRELIRDTSTRSRANIGAYVPDSARLSHVGWTDLEGTWPRTQGPGWHEPRSILHFRLDGVQVVIAHQPPKNAQHVHRLQSEGIEAIARLMTPRKGTLANGRGARRPRVCLADFNRRETETGPGPARLAGLIGGHVATSRIDTAVARGGTLSNARYLESVPTGEGRRLPLRSDHGHAMLVDFTWTPIRTTTR